MGNKVLLLIAILMLGGLLVVGLMLMWPGNDSSSLAKSNKSDATPKPSISDIDDINKGEQEKVVLPPDKSVVQTSEIPKDDDPLGPGEGLLDILVIHKETGKPIKCAEIALEPDTIYFDEKKKFYDAMETQCWIAIHELTESSVAWSDGEQSCTDQSGRASIRLPSGVPFKLEATGTEFTRHVIKVEALLPREQREVVFAVGPLVFFGRVTENDLAQQTLTGVKIFLAHENKHSTVTDLAGLFSMRVGSLDSESDYVSICEEGYGPVLVKLTKGHETPDKALLIKLDRAATMYGQVLDPAGPAVGAKVSLSTDDFQISQGDDSVFAEEDPAWHAITDSSGSYRIEDLPPSVEIEVMVVLKDKKPVQMSKRLCLKPGEEYRADWALGGLATIRGWVMSQNGRPVVSVPVKVMAPKLPDEFMKLLMEDQPIYMRKNYKEIIGETQTDQKGAFVIPNLSPGIVMVGVLPDEKRSFISHIEDGPDLAHKRDLDVSTTGLMVQINEGETDKEIVIKVHRGLYIRGLVLDPSDRPASDISVHAFQRESMGMVSTISNVKGRFEVGPLLPGKYRLSAMGLTYAFSEDVEANAGDEDVVLRLNTGGTISGLVLGDPGLNLDMVEIMAWNRDSGTGSTCNITSDGVFRIDNLPSGYYDVHATLGDDWIGFYLGAHVVEGSETEDLQIRLESSAKLIVRLKGGKGIIIGVLEYQGCIIERGSISLDKPAELSVPPGHLILSLYRMGEDKSRGLVKIDAQEIDINAGEQKEIVFDIDG